MKLASQIKLAILAVVALIVAFVCLSSFYTVNEKERAVVLRNGAVKEVAGPGLHFKTPILETTHFISTENYTTGYKSVQAYSQDQQTAILRVSVSWHVAAGDVAKVYVGYGDLDSLSARLLDRQVPTQVENVFGRYTASSAVKNRAELVADLTKALRTSITGPLVVDSVQIENIDFDDAYEASIRKRMDAEVAIETSKQQYEDAKVKADTVRVQAQATADAKLAAAKAEAEGVRVLGDATAAAIKARAVALGSNPELVELTKAEKWNGVLPTSVVPNGALPFVDARK